MANECSICLSTFKDPVCTPCGHIYCAICLSGHVFSASTRDNTALCPGCRTPFPVVIPELTTLLEHLRRFIIPSVRRVYVDTASYQKLQNRFSAVKRQVHDLKHDLNHAQTTSLAQKRQLEEREYRWTGAYNELVRTCGSKEKQLAQAVDMREEWRRRHNTLLETNVSKEYELKKEARAWQTKYELLKARFEARARAQKALRVRAPRPRAHQ
ncbi:hypothetical protein GYMLUDRAFT_47162 [Collybiopsis luxurians FD-317 M1]|uniref:RING-type domain-containing protein n=1 Tax=Collybiopsis luxurians FD-317 M1 TaxID=944289 RepID=A0A0D0CEB1_9AGAR|nr:hypothetical protein GYMLUDRAFT_47162 [Collybiopsis luxurians FD-317 M1]